jgi:7-cyano-7-deazaguanine tRNA-ribosyltransferase
LNFEVIETDGFTRRGKIMTKHGTVCTPAVFPVHDLGDKRIWHTPQYWKVFPQINTGMFNASLIKENTDPKISAILETGIHKFLDFNGVAFVDSGGWIYRKHKLNFSQEEILILQEKVGADIASSLDFPVKLMYKPDNQDMTESVHNAIWASKNRNIQRMLLFASIHGNDPIVLRNIIRLLNKKGNFDGFAVGSLLPIYSNYSLLVDIIIAVRRELPHQPIHVYGLAGPVIAELLAFLGVDTMDSSSFVISAANKCYAVPGFRRIHVRDMLLSSTPASVSNSRTKQIKSKICSCKICTNHSVFELATNRELLSFHNLWVVWSQLKKFTLAFEEHRLTEYINERYSKTPWARKAFRYATHKMRFGS